MTLLKRKGGNTDLFTGSHVLIFSKPDRSTKGDGRIVAPETPSFIV